MTLQSNSDARQMDLMLFRGKGHVKFQHHLYVSTEKKMKNTSTQMAKEKSFVLLCELLQICFG